MPRVEVYACTTRARHYFGREHESGINSVRRKSGDLKKSPYTPVEPSAKKYRGKEDKKKRRNACNYRNAFSGVPRGEDGERPRVLHALVEGNDGKQAGTGGPIGPPREGRREGEKERKRDERGSPKSRAAVSLDI